RLDELVVRRGLTPSRQQAHALILAGKVDLRGKQLLKPGMLVPEDSSIALRAAPRFVSRGGEKLAHALDRFAIGIQDRVCADIGASTGGFTDCLLQRGARRIFAIDVGYGQLHWKLRTDEHVLVLERTNARYLGPLDEPASLVTVDASFISLRTLLPAIRRIASDDGDIIALVKPQFEAGRDRVGKGGVVRDPAVHRDVLTTFAAAAAEDEFALRGLTASPLKGPAGN